MLGMIVCCSMLLIAWIAERCLSISPLQWFFWHDLPQPLSSCCQLRFPLAPLRRSILNSGASLVILQLYNLVFQNLLLKPLSASCEAVFAELLQTLLKPVSIMLHYRSASCQPLDSHGFLTRAYCCMNSDPLLNNRTTLCFTLQIYKSPISTALKCVLLPLIISPQAVVFPQLF